MPWKVKACAWTFKGPKWKVVARLDEEPTDDDMAEFIRTIGYWVRNAEPGEKVVIKRFPPGEAG